VVRRAWVWCGWLGGRQQISRIPYNDTGRSARLHSQSNGCNEIALGTRSAAHRAGQVNIASAVETATYRSGHPLLYETTLFYRDHEMSVGCSMPHDIRPTGVGLGVGRITSHQVRGIHNHDMPARLDPIIAFSWRRCKWISVAGIGASVQHVYQANLTLRGIFLAHPGHDPFQRIGIASPRIVTRRGGIIWHAPEAIVSLSQCLHGAISLWRINCRAYAHSGLCTASL